MTTTIAFRADASTSIGAGHLSRCLTLAESLKHDGFRIVVVCAAGSPVLVPRITTVADAVMELPYPAAGAAEIDTGMWLRVPAEVDAEATLSLLSRESIDWLIVDHYGLDAAWEQIVRRGARHVMVIDDLANRAHDCDVLLDQNLYPDLETRYAGLVPTSCTLFLGPRYALLRDEFLSTSPRIRDGAVRRLLLSFGGSDSANATTLAVEGVLRLDRRDLEVDVVIGQSHPFRKEIEVACDVPGITLHIQSSEMARLISVADLAVGAGGSSIWERSILGLPTLTIITADNQRSSACYLDAIGVSPLIGELASTNADDIAEAVARMRESPATLRQLSLKALEVMKGHEAASRIVGTLS
jgi:UDP-2,4-diacetamido-2,4,6-trideoxy-beta-L-altropyranose hydrolase